MLSGSNGSAPALLLAVGKRASRLSSAGGSGRAARARFVQELIFGAQNKPFKPARTPFDWLSRDPAEVDKYVADPLCGFPISAGLAVDLLEGLKTLASPELAAPHPQGTADLCVQGRARSRRRQSRALIDVYRAAGLARVTYKVYPDARHETLNETNRDEVTARSARAG